MEYVISIVFAYLIGSLPFSYIVAKILNNVDIRTVGSKNIGATNVFRTCGKFSGTLAFILDSAKGGVCFFGFSLIFKPEIALIISLFCVFGHCYSVFLKFKGGKGVASAAGLFLFLNPLIFLILVAVFFMIIYLLSYVSLASMIVVILAPLVHFIIYKNISVFISLLVLALFVIYRHKANIIRIKNGEENRVKVFKI